MYVGERGTGECDAVVFALGLKIKGERNETLHLRGLDPDALYSVREINCGARMHATRGAQSSVPVSGRDLMERGLAVVLSGDYDSAVLELRHISGQVRLNSPGQLEMSHLKKHPSSRSTPQ